MSHYCSIQNLPTVSLARFVMASREIQSNSRYVAISFASAALTNNLPHCPIIIKTSTLRLIALYAKHHFINLMHYHSKASIRRWRRYIIWFASDVLPDAPLLGIHRKWIDINNFSVIHVKCTVLGRDLLWKGDFINFEMNTWQCARN